MGRHLATLCSRLFMLGGALFVAAALLGGRPAFYVASVVSTAVAAVFWSRIRKRR